MIEGKNSITMSSSNCLTCHSQKAFIKALKKQLGEQEKKMSQLIDIAKRAINAKKLLEEQVKTLQQQNGGVSTKKTRRKVSKEERMEKLLEKYKILKLFYQSCNDKDDFVKSSDDDSQLIQDYKVADSSKRSTCLLQFVYGIGKRLAAKDPKDFLSFCEKIVLQNGTNKDDENFDKKSKARRKDLQNYLNFYKILNYFHEVGKWKNLHIFLQIEFYVSHLFKLMLVDKKENENSKVLKTINKYEGTETTNSRKVSPLERALTKLVEEETKKDEA